ncbi:chymotrypsin-1-like [Spodoptera frugiperda]|uniref:Chymotrypsin-1-like n=1 Tax=Spodoptera frugiperda TaxID=7108 RepID=A0A9R0EUX8_SPOFR|nr:chymotrypsin-1-like [Spodoptera frugiperda]
MEFLTVFLLFGVMAAFVSGVPLPSSDHQAFIVGGEDAAEGSAPYMVSLVFGERVMFQLCGASLISRRLMLTAAHCLEPFINDDGGLLHTLHSRVGSNQWNSGGTMVTLKGCHLHPQWDSTNIKYDAGVLVTEAPVELTDRVALISLSYDFVEGNEEAFVAGWGRTGPKVEGNVIHLQPTPDDKQVLYVDILDHDQCQEQMQVASQHNAPPIQRAVEICSFHSRGHGMCVGDSGSALVRLSTMQQIGIVSWGYMCAMGAPDVHVRILGVKDFLEFTMSLYND